MDIMKFDKCNIMLLNVLFFPRIQFFMLSLIVQQRNIFRKYLYDFLKLKIKYFISIKMHIWTKNTQKDDF